MNKNLIVAILFLIVGLSGCIDGNNNDSSSHPEQFVGTWANKEIPAINFTLSKDGEYLWGLSQSGTWEVKDGQLIIEIENNKTEFNFVFSNNNQQLQLTTSGNTITYVKQ